MSAVWYRVWRRLRVGRAAVLGLTIVVALGGGLALTLLAGATRTLSAPDRYTDARSRGIDATVEQANGRSRADELARLPGVERVVGVTFVFGGLLPVGDDGGPVEFVGPDEDTAPLNSLVFVGRTRAMGADLIRGREPDPADPGEFAVSSGFIDQYGAKPGDHFQLVTLRQATADQFGFEPPEGPDGPTLRATLVGVFEGASELQDDYSAAVFPPTLLDEGDGDIGVSGSQLAVSLRDGTTIRELREQLDSLLDGGQFGISETEIVPADVRKGVDGQAQGLILLAIIVTLAAVVVVGQILGRQVRISAGERLVLRGTGAAPTQLLAEPLAMAAVPAIAGAVLAAVVALIASQWFPIGFARRVEPTPGIRFDPLVHVAGAAVFALGVLLWVAVSIAVASRDVRPALGTTWIERVARRVQSCSIATALRFAFGRDPSTGHTQWSRVATLVVVMTGVVAALTFGASLAHLFDDPPAFGAPQLGFGAGGQVAPDELVQALDGNPEIDAFALYHTVFAAVGTASVDITGVQPVRGGMPEHVVEGRFPAADDEIILGQVTARQIDASVGDRISVKSDAGTRRFRVVGLGVILATEGGDGAGKGGMVTMDGLRAIDPDSQPSSGGMRLRGGVDVERFQRRLHDELGIRIGPLDRPPVITNAGRVRPFPFIVAGALGLLAVLNLGHLLLLAGSRRRHEVAVLRALGATRRWAAALMHWQATLIAGATLVVAIPLGVFVGQVVYQAYVDRIGVIVQLIVPAVAIVVVVLGLLLLANLAAIVPARRLRRASPAADLAAE